MTTPYLAADLIRDEGEVDVAYQDSLGIWTDGVGHAHVLPGTVITHAQAMTQLSMDQAVAVALCDHHIPWWRNLNDARQDVLANMMFNMGWLTPDGQHGLGTFVNTLATIQAGNYAAGARMMLASRWAKQVGKRADRLAAQMQFGFRAGGSPSTPAQVTPPPQVVSTPAPSSNAFFAFLHRLFPRFA